MPKTLGAVRETELSERVKASISGPVLHSDVVSSGLETF